jgi:hypothetical protein
MAGYFVARTGDNQSRVFPAAERLWVEEKVTTGSWLVGRENDGRLFVGIPRNWHFSMLPENSAPHYFASPIVLAISP